MALAATLLPGEAFLERSSASSTPKESVGEGLSPAHIRPGSSSGLDGVAFAEEGMRMTEEERKEWEMQWAETKKNRWTYGHEDVARDKEDSDRRMEHYRAQVEAQRRVLGGIYAKLRVDPDSACSPFTEGVVPSTMGIIPSQRRSQVISPSHREMGLVALTQEEFRRRTARDERVRQRQDLLQEEKTKKDEVVLTRTETRDTRRAHYLQEAQEEHQRRFFIKNSRHKETQKAQRELERDHERFTEAYYAALEKPRRFKLKSRGTPDGTADGGLVGRRSSEPPKTITLDEELQAADGTHSMDVLENIVKSHEFYSGTLDRWEKFVATNETRMNAYWYKMLNGFTHSSKPPSSGTRAETTPDMRLLKRKVKVALARESFMRQIYPGAAKEKRGALLPVLDDRAAQEKIEKKDRAVEEARQRAVAIYEERAAKVAKSNERRFQRVQSCVAMSKVETEVTKDRTPRRHKCANEFEVTRLPVAKEPVGKEDSERWAAVAQHAEQVRAHADQIQERARMQVEAKIAKKEEELKSRQALQEKILGEKKKLDVAEVSQEKRDRRQSQDAEYRNKAQERIELKQARSDAFQHKKLQSVLEKEKALRRERRQSGQSAEKDAMPPKSPDLLSGRGSPEHGASPMLSSTAEVPTPLSGSQQLRRVGPGLDQNPTASPKSTLHAAPPPLDPLLAASGQGPPVKASSSLRKVTKDHGAHLGGRSPHNLSASAPQLGDIHFYDEEDNHLEFPDCEEEERSILAELERRSSGWLRELQSKKNKSMGNWRAAK